jgi:hypothetical protein
MLSQKDDHQLEFDEAKHRYTLDGNRVPGATTFGKGGYPTSEQLIGWQVAQGAIYTAAIIQRLRREKLSRVIEGELLAAIIKRSKKASAKVSKRAAGIGTIVHDYAYLVELGRTREALQMLSEHENHPDWQKINNGVKKYEEWHAQNKGETVLLEAIVASVVHQFGGKFDHLSVRNGLLILSDYKTSNGIYVDMFIQLASYAIAIEEWLDKWFAQYNLPLKVGGLEILRFGKEAGDDFQPLLITDPQEIEQLKAQAIRCRDTYRFRLRWESDKRFKYNGQPSKNSGEVGVLPKEQKPITRKRKSLPAS